MSETKEETKAAEAPQAEAAAAAPEADTAAAKPIEQKLEKFYVERGVKDGTVFLKRKKGDPRFRKIVAKKGQAQLYRFDRGTWHQKSALAPRGLIHGMRWHLRNKWVKVEEKDIPKAGPSKQA